MVTIPGYLSSTTPLLLEGCETFADYTITGGTGGSDNTTQKSQGSHSLKLTGSGTVTATKAIAGQVFSGSAYDVQGFDVYRHNPTNRTVRLGLFTDATLTRGMIFAGTTYQDGWNRFQPRRAQWTAIGAGTFADTMTRIGFQALTLGVGESVSIDNWQYNITPSVGVIVWTLHDSWDTLYTAGYPVFYTRGIRGSLVCDTARIGTANHMSWAQYKAMVADGWDVVNHFQTHNNPVSFTQAQVQTEINAAEADYVSNAVGGSPYTRFCAPGGGWSDNIRAACAAEGYTFGHGITEGICYLPNPEPLRCEVRSGQTATNSVATLEALYDSIKVNGGAVIHYAHEIGNTYGVGNVSATDLATLLDYANSIGVPFVTLAQLGQLQAGQSVTTSPAFLTARSQRMSVLSMRMPWLRGLPSFPGD